MYYYKSENIQHIRFENCTCTKRMLLKKQYMSNKVSLIIQRERKNKDIFHISQKINHNCSFQVMSKSR